jgi:4-hydroxy-3-methylbut-2-en-1-yl diphosphate synthase IspG/GcpE
MVGNVPVGSKHPIARQTMTTTDTRDVEATVAQARLLLRTPQPLAHRPPLFAVRR